MKLLLFLSICMSSMGLYSQSVEIFGGPSKNLFYGKNQDYYSYFTADYYSGNGFTAGIAIDSIKILRLGMRFSVQFDKYNGNFSAEGNSGKAIYEKTIGEIDKSSLSLGIFPINIRMMKKVEFNFGAEAAYLLDESVTGTSYRGNLFNGGELIERDLNGLYSQFNSKVVYGLKFRIAYQWHILNKIYLVPQYSYYYGLSNEFVHFPDATKSMRHSLCLGIKRK